MEESDKCSMHLINILSIKMQPFVFLFTELSSQSEPGRDRSAASPRRGRRPVVELPEGLQLRRPDGTFYDLVPPVAPVTTPNHFHIGILEPDGTLRPFYFLRRQVKVHRDWYTNGLIIPLSQTEINHYPFNRSLAPHNDEAADHVAENSRRQRPRRGD